MAHKIAFDYRQALDEATWLFWKGGYAGTSVRDLLRVMGIGEGSFYNTLKSKKRLYLECLKRYQETEGRKRRLALMSGARASQGLRALFAVMLDCMEDPGTPSRLCMMAAMACEEVLADPELREVIETGTSQMHATIAKRLRQDRKAGMLPPGPDPHVIASIIITYAQGIWRMALVHYDRPRFERQIDVFLAGLGL
jgi:TetR/AcrR family transcriptional repressor of nem operon